MRCPRDPARTRNEAASYRRQRQDPVSHFLITIETQPEEQLGLERSVRVKGLGLGLQKGTAGSRTSIDSKATCV